MIIQLKQAGSVLLALFSVIATCLSAAPVSAQAALPLFTDASQSSVTAASLDPAVVRSRIVFTHPEALNSSVQSLKANPGSDA